jgi:hypothetical protein
MSSDLESYRREDGNNLNGLCHVLFWSLLRFLQGLVLKLVVALLLPSYVRHYLLRYHVILKRIQGKHEGLWAECWVCRIGSKCDQNRICFRLGRDGDHQL